MKQDVKPTRMELIEIRKKIALSERGYKLLKMKRDGLILEFFQMVSKAKDIRSQMTTAYVQAEERLTIAKSIDSVTMVASAAFAVGEEPQVTLGSKNVMGVVVPTTVESGTVKKRADQRGFGIVGESVRIHEATSSYEDLVEKIIVAAELETTLKRLVDEIEKTKRKVNALEYRILPELREAESFIRLRLEELERENIFRLKRIKDRVK